MSTVVTGQSTTSPVAKEAIKSTNGALHVAPQGTGIHVAASVDVNLAVAADVEPAVAAAAGLRLVGFAAVESAGVPAAADFVLVHGATVAGGTEVVHVKLVALESKTGWFGPDGIAVPNGISIDRVAGTSDIIIFYKTIV